MNKEDFINLTNNLYRLTLLFPKKEPLRYKMRELADDILTNLINNQHPALVKNLEVLDGFFEVAKSQNWVSPSDIVSLQQEYRKLKEERSLAPSANRESQTISERQEKILAFLREKGRVQVWQVKQTFPDVSKRTLRRDFEFLLKHGKIERIGEKNNTFYQIKRS